MINFIKNNTAAAAYFVGLIIIAIGIIMQAGFAIGCVSFGAGTIVYAILVIISKALKEFQ
jgi:hypothetical protein